MPTTRENYYTKYKDIYKKWKLPEKETYKIINRYATQLLPELLELEKNKYTLPRYYRDIRTPDEYIYDILDGWLIEDLIKLWLETRGHTVEHYGADRDRVIIKTDAKKIKINNTQDLLVDGKPLEIQLSRQLRQTYHVKENKIRRLIDDSGMLMFVVLPTNQYFTLDQSSVEGLDPIRNPRWGGKMTYEFSIDKYYNLGDQYVPKSNNR